MEHEELNAKIDAYIDEVWEQVVEDIDTLVRIPSTEDLDHAAPGAPYGEGPAEALKAGVALAEKLGYDATNMDGHIAFADLPGKSDTQIGIIGHLDVVPAGSGWNFEPFQVTRKDGYLIGRGVLDDKGPSVVAMYAMHFFPQHNIELPYTIRMIMGANEESGMRDVAYYREHVADPAFIFTPDADFPVCYGEKGGFDGRFESVPMGGDAMIVDFGGGNATNAVPAEAYAIVKADPSTLADTDRITVSDVNGNARLDAKGIGGHASKPEGTINAIGLIVDYLLENNLCSDEERAFLTLQHDLLSASDGSGVGVKTSDEHFGPLTLIGGTVEKDGDRIVQTIDIRYPTSITADELIEKLGARAKKIGAEFDNTLLMVPFLVEPDSPMIQALLDSFNDATGMHEKPFTIGGGTYAREFTSGASFGPNMPWLEHPDWIAGEHSANEGVSEDMLKSALKIYILTIDRLMKIDF
ncbi:Sapep family Mn(2+)-dependent dipeptidase [Raoultibacter phocaeensis]|uniref:Sapep family Mn(2+)-dependent dipeptidase n=1 Tax=Raoultibacter phocaeensis TaxID=2479841 RepID=UPI00111A3D67|nr:Sapep family Mn(2+)-dependent dipeptidase [Raoultibacter phocaeensis]